MKMKTLRSNTIIMTSRLGEYKDIDTIISKEQCYCVYPLRPNDTLNLTGDKTN